LRATELDLGHPTRMRKRGSAARLRPTRPAW
jgi:hypothetical protein